MPKKKNSSPHHQPVTFTELERVVHGAQREIIEAMGKYSQKVEARFDKVEGRLGKIEATMVTKDYLHEVLSDKLSDLRGDLVVLMRKEDTKVKELVDILYKKGVLAQAEVTRILALEPFARII